MTRVIDSFSGQYAWLSNFYAVPVELGNRTYPSVENAYQAFKTVDPAARLPFETCWPAQAKHMGRTLTLRPGWEAGKYGLMKRLVMRKFMSDSELRRLLLATAGATLIEGNWWHDTYWGVCNGVGQNKLGCILMRVRAQLFVENLKHQPA